MWLDLERFYTSQIFHTSLADHAKKVPTNDILQKRGVCVVSACFLCENFAVVETIDHLFVTCFLLSRFGSGLLLNFVSIFL